MKTIQQTYRIKAGIDKVWQALTDPKVITAWGGGSATMDEKEGAKFTLWGGDIHGTNTKIVKNKTLAQDWFSGDWEKPSKVTFTLTSKGEETSVDLLHEDVPDKEADDIADGWKKYYLGPLKDLLEK